MDVDVYSSLRKINNCGGANAAPSTAENPPPSSNKSV